MRRNNIVEAADLRSRNLISRMPEKCSWLEGSSCTVGPASKGPVGSGKNCPNRSSKRGFRLRRAAARVVLPSSFSEQVQALKLHSTAMESSINTGCHMGFSVRPLRLVRIYNEVLRTRSRVLSRALSRQHWQFKQLAFKEIELSPSCRCNIYLSFLFVSK